MIPQDEISTPLSQRLLAEGIITEDQLRIALQEQRRTGEMLGRTLRSLGFVKDVELSRAYSKELQIPHVDLQAEQLDPNAVMKVMPEFAKEKGVIPIRFQDDELVVAMADPYDVSAVDAIERLTRHPVFVVAAPEDQIYKVIGSFFSDREFSDASLEKLISNTRRDEGQQEEAQAEAPIIVLVDQIIMKGVADRATDIHIEPEEKLVRIRYRIDGVLHQGMTLPIELKNEIVSRMKIMAMLDIAEKRRPQDGQISIKRGPQLIDIRVSVVPVVWGEAVVLRLLDKSNVNISLEQLGMSLEQLSSLKKLVLSPHGILLVTGPTGSGKTTTLYGALKHINLLENSVLTLEDPVEYQIPLIRQTQVRPDIGFGFAEGLRSFLRQDPDVIMVGEIRDLETMQIAIRAALTGHLVLATLHTNSALEAIPRLVDMGVDPYLIGSVLIGLQAQRLVRKLCPRCGRPSVPRDDEREFLGAQGRDPALRLFHGEGCSECFGTGFRGREGVYEIFEVDEAYRQMIRKRVDLAELVAFARERGGSFLIDDGRRKVLAGITTVDEVRRVLA